MKLAKPDDLRFGSVFGLSIGSTSLLPLLPLPPPLTFKANMLMNGASSRQVEHCWLEQSVSPKQGGKNKNG